MPLFGKLWQIISLFFTVLLAVLLGGYIKEQWKKKDNTALFFGILIPFLWFMNSKSENKKVLNRK
jgi:peptidoglycan biosynthesis protein MviN/MurJ (putative lipid II flippase)